MARRKSSARSKKSKRKASNFLWISYIIGSLFIFGVIFSIITVLVLSRDLPPLSLLEKFEPNLVTQVYSADGKLVAEFGSEKRKLVSIEDIPRHLIHAVIAIEDQRFWNHWGVNVYRIPTAALKDLIAMRWKEGFSTLTMQLAKDLYFTPEKKISRKIREILTAVQIERTYTKNEIIEMYLNNSFFGHRIYGIASAAKVYFSKEVSELTLEESALLAGIIPLPNRYSPLRNSDLAKIRRNRVLYNMYTENYIKKKQLIASLQKPIKVKPTMTSSPKIASYFVEYIRIFLDEHKEEIGANYLTDGLKIYTTLDTRLQSLAEEFMKWKLDLHQKKINRRYKKRIELKNKTGKGPDFTVQGALVCLEPSTGYLRAMVGGKDFKKSQFNRAVQAKRQPGSTFKPFVYATAIDNGYKVTDKQLNQDVVLFMPDGTRWTPGNFDGSRGGPTTLREGLRKSLNLISVRLVLQKWAPAKRIAFLAEKMGITTEIHPYDALALGASEVYLFDITSAYCVFANQGIRVEQVSILRIEDRNGRTIWRSIPRKREVLGKETAYLMTNLLETVARAGTGSTSRSVYHFLRPAAGKTGTTNSFTDAWFVGFTPQLAAGVWVGFDEPELTLGNNETGARVALPIWAKFMKAAHDTLKLPVEHFIRPEGIVELEVCADSGDLATPYCPNVFKEVFNRKYKPEKKCSIHRGNASSVRFKATAD